MRVHAIVPLEALPGADAPEWESLRALNVGRIAEPVAEAIASHPRVEAVFGLECSAFRALLGNAPDIGLRHIELAPGHLPMPIAAFDRETTLPRLTRLAFATEVQPMAIPWLLTSAVGKRLTHVAFGLDQKDFAELLSVLDDFGGALQHVALLTPHGSEVVPLNLFTRARRPAAYVPWRRLVREGGAFAVRDVVHDDGAPVRVFDLLPASLENLPPPHVPRVFAPPRALPTFEAWRTPTPRPGVSPLEERAFWVIIDEARARAGGRDGEAFAVTVVDALKSRDPGEILAFSDRLDILVARAHTVELRVAVYIATGFWSDDGFLYFAHWLIAQGREAYVRVVETPDALVDVAPQDAVTPRDAMDLSFENLMYAARHAHEQRTGDELPSRPPDPSRTARMLSNTAPPPLDPANLPQRFPKIWARFRAPTSA